MYLFIENWKVRVNITLFANQTMIFQITMQVILELMTLKYLKVKPYHFPFPFTSSLPAPYLFLSPCPFPSLVQEGVPPPSFASAEGRWDLYNILTFRFCVYFKINFHFNFFSRPINWIFSLHLWNWNIQTNGIYSKISNLIPSQQMLLIGFFLKTLGECFRLNWCWIGHFMSNPVTD